MPTSMDKSAPNPAPCTTFVQTDAATFKDLVQRLTGAARDQPSPPPTMPSHNSSSRPPPEPAAAANSAKVAGAKRLHERRQGFLRPKLAIDKPVNVGRGGGGSILMPVSPAILSPSISPLVSPSTPLEGLHIGDDQDELINRGEEERAIKERRFYLHPSPMGRTRSTAEPELLPLFPMSSPRSEYNS